MFYPYADLNTDINIVDLGKLSKDHDVSNIDPAELTAEEALKIVEQFGKENVQDVKNAKGAVGEVATGNNAQGVKNYERSTLEQVKARRKVETTKLERQIVNLARLLHKRVSHFPSNEQQGLAATIKQLVSEMTIGQVESRRRRRYKKKPLLEVDMQLEQLRSQIYTSFELGLFAHPLDKAGKKSAYQTNLERFLSLTTVVDTTGRLLGASIKHADLYDKDLKDESKMYK